MMWRVTRRDCERWPRQSSCCGRPGWRSRGRLVLYGEPSCRPLLPRSRLARHSHDDTPVDTPRCWMKASGEGRDRRRIVLTAPHVLFAPLDPSAAVGGGRAKHALGRRSACGRNSQSHRPKMVARPGAQSQRAGEGGVGSRGIHEVRHRHAIVVASTLSPSPSPSSSGSSSSSGSRRRRVVVREAPSSSRGRGRAVVRRGASRRDRTVQRCRARRPARVTRTATRRPSRLRLAHRRRFRFVVPAAARDRTGARAHAHARRRCGWGRLARRDC